MADKKQKCEREGGTWVDEHERENADGKIDSYCRGAEVDD